MPFTSPPDYDHSKRSYPVLYLLHGGEDDQRGWVQFGEVKHIADKAIKEGNATPMIIVMPDARAGYKGFFNNPIHNWRYEDFFVEEFLPYVEKTYRIKILFINSLFEISTSEFSVPQQFNKNVNNNSEATLRIFIYSFLILIFIKLIRLKG